MDKELLFKSRIQEADVELPDVGTVRVRGLTQEERGQCVRQVDLIGGELNIARGAAIARRMVAAAMVDPEMTVEEVDRWCDAAPAGELDAVVEAIEELSGMKEGAAKAAYKSVRGRRRA